MFLKARQRFVDIFPPRPRFKAFFMPFRGIFFKETKTVPKLSQIVAEFLVLGFFLAEAEGQARFDGRNRDDFDRLWLGRRTAV